MPFGAAAYAMAVHYETVEGGDESADKWAIMVRNAGNEGDCSDQKDHPMTPGMGSLSLYLRHPVSYDSAEPDPNARYGHRPAPVASFSARLGNRPSQPIAENYRFDDDAGPGGVTLVFPLPKEDYLELGDVAIYFKTGAKHHGATKGQTKQPQELIERSSMLQPCRLIP